MMACEYCDGRGSIMSRTLPVPARLTIRRALDVWPDGTVARSGDDRPIGSLPAFAAADADDFTEVEIEFPVERDEVRFEPADALWPNDEYDRRREAVLYVGGEWHDLDGDVAEGLFYAIQEQEW